MASPKITAVLGPTNTGKTHLAVERMLGHSSGMIGFPLRLLARENYERIAAIKGRTAVALVTGEERIVPPYARWFVCTVEAMPMDRDVAFLAIDEIQMVADRERGHVFTDRLLHARGREETMFMGAASAKRLIRALVPGVEFVERPRLSTLSYTGPRKITRLPRRSAAVAFSAAEVYSIAELVRRQRGGCALVFGALSPRTRNAQVALYQSGDVDYLVATDAIGMGLNMDIDHVAFAQLAKFDGRALRRLSDAELGQIAGRAGRHMNDGTFGTTADMAALDPETVRAIEEHEYPRLEHAYWRNSDLDFRTLDGLLATLDARPARGELIKIRDADDHVALRALANDPDIRTRAEGRVALLWEVARIPDFRKTMSDGHTRLLARIFGFLSEGKGRLPPDWVAKRIAELDDDTGDIERLLERIAGIRIWTYVAHREDWLADAATWAAKARGVEDKLSDALHARLTERFVDRRNAMLARKLEDGVDLAASVASDGAVAVEGVPAGRLRGFEFVPDPSLAGGAERVRAAANKALRRDAPARAAAFVAEPDSAFALDAQGRVLWRGATVARLVAGPSALEPELALARADLLEPASRRAVDKRLADWCAAHLRMRLAPLFRLRDASLAGPARGLAFRLVDALGAIPTDEGFAALDGPARGALVREGVRLAAFGAFVPALKDHGSTKLRALLWSIRRGRPAPSFAEGRVSLPRDVGSEDALAACLYLPAGPLYVRADRLDALARSLAGLAKGGAFALDPALAKIVACEAATLPAVVAALGYRAVRDADAVKFVPKRARKPGPRKAVDADSPFAALGKLVDP
jgi:ATP-dependent RNA helicase SUPV3L1/SUV3